MLSYLHHVRFKAAVLLIIASGSFYVHLAMAMLLYHQKFKGTVYTFGFGSDHDSNLLEAISSQGGGVYYFIDSTDKVMQHSSWFIVSVWCGLTQVYEWEACLSNLVVR